MPDKPAAPAAAVPVEKSGRRRLSRAGRILLTVVVVIAVLAGVAVVADSLVAARVEKRISERIHEDSHLANPPDVVVTGMPYLAAVFTHEVPSIHVDARDVEVPGFGRVTMSSSATEITLDRDAVLSGTFTDAPAREVFTRIQMDTVELGEKFGIPDLALRSQDDSSPTGGWETEAFLSGTPEGLRSGADGEYEVSMRLRVWEGDVYLTPVEITDTPDGTDPDDLPADTREKVMDAFTLEMPGTSLPLHSKPRRVYSSGGSLFIEAEQNYTTVSVTDLAPQSGPLGEDEQPGL
ncbi:MAG: LmeA family phospholipid-binding protein [Mycobacteriaceae bacterium]